jgi:hypothetical protein
MQFSSTFQQVPLMVVSSDTVTAGLTLTATRIFSIFLSLSFSLLVGDLGIRCFELDIHRRDVALLSKICWDFKMIFNYGDVPRRLEAIVLLRFFSSPFLG